MTLKIGNWEYEPILCMGCRKQVGVGHYVLDPAVICNNCEYRLILAEQLQKIGYKKMMKKWVKQARGGTFGKLPKYSEKLLKKLEKSVEMLP